MQGSLNLPPIVIRSSRWTAALLLLIAACFVAVGVWMLTDPKQSRLIAWLEIAFFGLGIPLFGWRLIRPDILILAPDGITWRSMFRTSSWKWSELQAFRDYAPADLTISKHLGFDFAAGYNPQHSARPSSPMFSARRGQGGWRKADSPPGWIAYQNSNSAVFHADNKRTAFS